MPGGNEAALVVQAELAEEPSGRGPRIRIVIDSGGFGDEAELEVRRAVRIVTIADLAVVVGHGGSRASLAAAPVYSDAGVPLIIPTSTSRLLAGAGAWLFRLAPDDSVEGAFIGRYAAERLGARRVAVFYQNDEYGSGLRDGVAAELAARGVTVTSTPIGAGSDLATMLDAELRRGMPDVIVSAAQSLETGLLAQLVAGRAPAATLIAGDGALLLPNLPQAAGAAIDRIVNVSFWVSGGDSLSRAFEDRFERVAGYAPTGNDAMRYDALRLAVAAVRAAGPDRMAVRRWLESLGVTREPYAGVTGPISFVAGRQLPLVMVRVRDGRMVPVEAAP